MTILNSNLSARAYSKWFKIHAVALMLS